VLKNYNKTGCIWACKNLKILIIIRGSDEIKQNQLNKAANSYAMMECHHIRYTTEVMT
jgi:hypothetical protein